MPPPARLAAADIGEAHSRRALRSPAFPDPDLLIRTGGEQRISNFLLWNLAYTELYFTRRRYGRNFRPRSCDAAFEFYAQRERRFGKTSAQVAAKADA